MGDTTTLGEALGEIVDEILKSYGVDKDRNPVIRQLLYQAAAMTASLMVKHYNREQLEHEELTEFSPKWGIKGNSNVH